MELGATNDKFVEITKGITDGTIVALNPLALLSENEKRELFGVNGKAAGKKDWAGFGKGKVVDAEAGKAAPAAPGKPAEIAVAKAGGPGAAKAKAGPDGKSQGKTKGRARGLAVVGRSSRR